MIDGNVRVTKKGTTRITITISKDLYDLFNELSHLTGKSMAHIPAFVLEESRPTFEALITAYATAKHDKEKAVSDMVEFAERSMVKAAMIISDD